MLLGHVGDVSFVMNHRTDSNVAQSIRPGYTQPATTRNPATVKNSTGSNHEGKDNAFLPVVVAPIVTSERSKPLRTLEDLVLKPLEIRWSLDYDIEKIHEIILSYLKSKKERKEVLKKALVLFRAQGSTDEGSRVTAEDVVTLKSKILKINEEFASLDKISSLDYAVRCSSLVKEYKELCKSAPKIFGQKTEPNNAYNNRKTRIVADYLEHAKDFYPMNITRDIQSNGLCPICSNLIIDNGEKYVCSGCNSIQSKVETAPEYTNVEDFSGKHNMSTDKSNVNYQDIILQIQANYPVNIPQRIYDTITNVTSTYKNFDITKLSKLDLYKIMKEQGLNFWYKHLNKIHKDITGKKATDLSKYEQNLFRRGELLNHIYNDIKSPDRSNFMHGLYLVWLFLMNEGATPDMQDFFMIKSRGTEVSNIETLEKGFEILRRTNPEFQWRIFQLP